MRLKKIFQFNTSFTALFLAVFIIGSVNQSAVSPERSINDEPAIVSTSPSDGEVNVARNAVIEITFNEDVDSTSMNGSSFTLMQGTESVSGTLEFSGNKAMFTTTNSLKAETDYTANLTTAANRSDDDFSIERNERLEDEEINDEELNDERFNNEESDFNRTPSVNGKEWSFTTGGNSDSVEKVDLGSAADYVILAQSSINNDSTSQITGEKGFDNDSRDSKDNKTAYWLKNEDIDKEAVRRDREDVRNEREEARRETTQSTNENREYSTNDTTSNAGNMNNAVDDMVTAYNDSEARSPADFIDYKFHKSDVLVESSWNFERDDDSERDSELSQDERDNKERNNEMRDNADQRMSERTTKSSATLEPGIYKWNDSVEISSNITLSGNADDVWIFQISEDLTVNRDVEINLSDGAVAENIFWQVAGEVNLEENSHFEGIILSQSGITMKNGATLNGRMLAQTDVTLDDNTIIEPQGLASVQSTSSSIDEE
ncbi:MAG: DUF3494 domain-containing protein [Balneolaceae bacterium]|nr:DUF3494 domain-containing protein [Balneolaceae bacterium]